MNVLIRSVCRAARRLTQIVGHKAGALSTLRRGRQRTCLSGVLLAFVCCGFSVRGQSNESSPSSIKGNAQEIVGVGPWEGDLVLDDEFPHSKREEFKSGCVEGHIALGFMTVAGCRVWYVPKGHWPKAHRLAQSLQIPTITPREGIPVGDSICVVSAAAFHIGHWDSAFEAALGELRGRYSHNDTLEGSLQELAILDVRHTLRECHLRSVNAAKGLKLPHLREWTQIKAAFSRTEQIEYLGNRLGLSKGIVNSNGLIVPRCILNTSRRGEPGAPIFDTEGRDDQPIDPFLELLNLEIRRAEVSQLYQYFAVNWTFQPEGDFAVAELRLHAASRYCLCVVINNVFGRRNGIREYDLTDDEWRDAEKIAVLVRRQCIDPLKVGNE